MRSFMKRRSFMKKTSASLTGAALAVAGTSSLYANAGNNSNKLALLGGSPVRTKSFGQLRPIFDDNEGKVLLKALRSRNWCCLRGNDVYDFQKEFAQLSSTMEGILREPGGAILSPVLIIG